MPSKEPAWVQTEREENRLRDLLETQAISQREYDNAVSESAITRAGLQQAEVRVRDAELNFPIPTSPPPSAASPAASGFLRARWWRQTAAC